jgi:SMI1-KNR4 cell-wall
MIKQWQELFEQQEIYGDIFDFSTESELLQFEARTGIILPTGYKEYCQIFGSGGFGNDLLNISTVNNEVSWTLDDMTNEMRENMNLEAYCGDVITAEKLENLREILKSALLFGGNGKGQFSLWDLRTYNITDDSYDIYLASYH